MSNLYQIRLHPDGSVERLQVPERVRIAEVGTIRHRKIDSDSMDFPGGVLIYDEASEAPANMPATRLVKMHSMEVIRGSATFGMLDEDGVPNTSLDEETADWVTIWARGRCTVCGRSDYPASFPAFPVSSGKCCTKCDAVMRSVRSYMGFGNWKPRERK